MVKCMKMLGNFLCGINPHQKWLLYRTCVLPITFYVFSLWYYNTVPLAYSLKELRKIQRRVALWILRAFHTSLTLGNKAIADLVLIHLHLQKNHGCYQLRISTLSNNHAIKSLLKRKNSEHTNFYRLLLENLTPKQWLNFKGPIIDTNNCLNGIFPSFNSLNYKISPRTQ